MQDQFNLVSLAQLSKTELITLLSKLTAEFHAAGNDADRTAIQSQIAAVRLSLNLQ